MLRWNEPSSGAKAVKPTCQFEDGRFPRIDYFFHSGLDRWQSYSSSNDGDDRWEFRSRYNLGREYLIESAREHTKEMVAFAVVVVASAWPVIYMIVSVVQLLLKGRPLQ
jgi:hypothetical protein